MKQIQTHYQDVFVRVPQSRGHRDKIAAFAMAIGFTLAVAYFSKQETVEMDITSLIVENHFSVQGVLAIISMLILCQMLADTCYRLALFCEEASHVESRYKKDWRNAFNAIFKLETRNMIINCALFIFSFTVLQSKSRAVYRHAQSHLDSRKNDVLSQYQELKTAAYSSLVSTQFLLLPPLYAAAYLLLHLVGFWTPRKHEIGDIKGIQSQLGHSFAWQYYYGYLKIILPSLVDRIEKFEKIKMVKIKIHKLFLLMPESCFLPNLLEQQAGDAEIEHVDNLEELSQDRSGNKNRKYSNPVYRISTRMEPVYCCMEGISMLNSLKDMCNNKATELTKEKCYQQICYFYSTLKNILEQEKLDHLVEIVFYKDRNENRQVVRISEVVMKRILELLLKTAG